VPNVFPFAVYQHAHAFAPYLSMVENLGTNGDRYYQTVCLPHCTNQMLQALSRYFRNIKRLAAMVGH
ncbi:MAG: hypothetical protein ACPGFC_01835, partial [Paracoccaceae bacterium]